jgi:hypothetical protein
MTWAYNTPAILAGTSRLTGHRLEIWDMNDAYRGRVNGENGTCPENPWVSMPDNCLSCSKGMSVHAQKLTRVKDVYECCVYKNYTGEAVK